MGRKVGQLGARAEVRREAVGVGSDLEKEWEPMRVLVSLN